MWFDKHLLASKLGYSQASEPVHTWPNCSIDAQKESHSAETSTPE